MGLKFQNFLKIFYFSPKFYKKERFSYFGVFATLPGTRRSKKGTLTSGASPYPFLPEWTPGLIAYL